MEYLIALLLGILGNIVAFDIIAHHRKWCTRIVEAAVNRVAGEEQRRVRKEEWLSQLADSEGVYECFRHALGCWMAAPAVSATARPAVVRREVRPDENEALISARKAVRAAASAAFKSLLKEAAEGFDHESGKLSRTMERLVIEGLLRLPIWGRVVVLTLWATATISITIYAIVSAFVH